MELFVLEESTGKRRRAESHICEQCGKEFLRVIRKPENKRKPQRFCTPECKSLSDRRRVVIDCAWCGADIERQQAHLNNSRSGLYFCNRKCKEQAQKLDGGIPEIQPAHYGDGERNRERNLRNLYATRRRNYEKRKLHFVNLLGGKCSKCGYDKNYAALAFHHLDPSKKESQIAPLQQHSIEWVEKEVKKCILLCHNCHAETHYADCNMPTLPG
jgi:YHS domain-containing protein